MLTVNIKPAPRNFKALISRKYLTILLPPYPFFLSYPVLGGWKGGKKEEPKKQIKAQLHTSPRIEVSMAQYICR